LHGGCGMRFSRVTPAVPPRRLMITLAAVGCKRMLGLLNELDHRLDQTVFCRVDLLVLTNTAACRRFSRKEASFTLGNEESRSAEESHHGLIRRLIGVRQELRPSDDRSGAIAGRTHAYRRGSHHRIC